MFRALVVFSGSPALAYRSLCCDPLISCRCSLFVIAALRPRRRAPTAIDKVLPAVPRAPTPVDKVLPAVPRALGAVDKEFVGLSSFCVVLVGVKMQPKQLCRSSR